MTIKLDELDHDLLAVLQQDAGRTLREIGEDVGLSPSAVLRRIDRYKRDGLFQRQVAVLDPTKTPELVQAVYLVTIHRESPQHEREFAERMRSSSYVQQAYEVSGSWDYVVIMAAVGMPEIRNAARSLFIDDNVKRYFSLFVLDPIKTGTALPTRAV